MNRLASLIVASITLIGCAKEAQIEEKAESAPAPVAVAQAPSALTDSALSAPSALPSAISVKVYKDPNCGCCVEWVKHLERNGFKVESIDLPDTAMVKQKHGIGRELQACHTAVIGDYVVEGHVPADVIMKMLREKPAIAGLAVPGMPMGSPGMEGATKEKYDILTFDRAGRTTVYAQR